MKLVIDFQNDCVSLIELPGGSLLNPVGDTIGTVNNALGNIITSLERDFPSFTGRTPEEFLLDRAENFLNDPPKNYWGFREFGFSLYTIYFFLNDKEGKTLTLKDVETFRIDHQISTAPLPLSMLDNNVGMIFPNIKSFNDILYGLIYFYAYNELKVLKCKHCGKWFATNTLKKQYCTRTSPCFGKILHGKSSISCEQAVRNILQNCGRIKNRIETKASSSVNAQLYQSSFSDDFYKECEPLHDAAKAQPTVENLTKYHDFLKRTEKERRWLKP